MLIEEKRLMGHKVFCPTCEQTVELRRKTFEHQYHEILMFMVIMTIGLGFIIYFILKYSKKPNTCPNCESVFDLKTLKPVEHSKKQR